MALCAALCLPACGGDSSSDPSGPRIRLIQPAEGTDVALQTGGAVPIRYEVSDFTLMAPGECPSIDVPCGHIHVVVDDGACNDPDLPYNTAGIENPLRANMLQCANPLGPHTLAVSLHLDNHALVTVDGEAATDAVSVNIVPGADATEPQVEITSPREGQTVELGADGAFSIEVDYRVQSFTLRPPGQCPEDALRCGHVHLMLNGTACNREGAPYNSAAARSPITGIFAECDLPFGEQTVAVELRNDDHSPVLDANGEMVQHLINITTVPPVPPPVITITAPGEGSEVTPEAGALVPVSFEVDGFDLAMPGSCASARCGHIQLLVDGIACNAPGVPYNALAAASPVSANLSLCDTAGGAHEITLALYHDDFAPVRGEDDAQVAATVRITAP